MGPTKIEYLDYTWNPIAMRCTPVSDGCRNCWHLTMANRLAKNPLLPKDEQFAYADWDTWKGPPVLKVRELEALLHLRKPARIGVQFMGDLFHEDVPDEWIVRILVVMALAGQHTFQVLTKRPKRMLIILRWLGKNIGPLENAARTMGYTFTHSGLSLLSWPIPNVWLGVSISTNKDLWMVETLLQIPAAKRFVSVEPMLGRIDFRAVDLPDNHIVHPDHTGLFGISWVICGGESGPKARPMHPDWARLLRDQCQAAAVPFFFKHWGEWSSNKPDPFYKKSKRRYSHETFAWARDGKIYNPINPPINHFPSIVMHKVGKKKAGRLLDGKEWNEIPV